MLRSVTTKRKPNSSDPRRDANGIGRMVPPGKRLRPLFKISQEMTDAGDYALAKAGPAPVATQEQFERTILMRGVNTLKAARLVAESGHWEIASACARQLYELVLNMEEIERSSDREQASISFAAYGMLQMLLFRKAEIEYERDTGRTYRVSQLDELEEHLKAPMFDEFRVTKPGKPDGWVGWWSEKNAWQLAKASSSVMRVPQYNTVFRKWSAEAHGAPGAVIGNMFNRTGPNWVEEAIRDDDQEISAVMQMAMLLLMDLWALLPNAMPFPAEKAVAWNDRLFAWIERDGRVPNDIRYPKRSDGSYIIAPLGT